MSRKIAIVGFAPSTRDKAPYNDPNWEIWVLNEYHSILPESGASNITNWFELHHRDTVLSSKRNTSYIDTLKASTIPVWMCQKHDDIPMSQAYPLEDIIKTLRTDYFTNSISYMVAMACYQHLTGNTISEMAVYGVDMAQDEEYAKERPSVEYFIGFAEAKGIPVYIPPESDICKCPYYYGFQEESASKICKTIDPKLTDLVTRMNNTDFVVDEMLENIDYKLKKYIIEISPVVKQIQAAESTLMKLHEDFNKSESEDEKKEIGSKIMELQNSTPAITQALYPAHDILSMIWSHNLELRASKKERLYLAGAVDISRHLRVQLCPFD